MDEKTHLRYESRARILKAIAHHTRLFIIEELQKRPTSVGDLAGMIGSDLSTVSKHLSVLKNAGIVSDERSGTTITYRLKTPCLLNFIGCVEDVLEANAKDQMEIVKCCKR
jgi:ArsR family transcriptional regulator